MTEKIHTVLPGQYAEINEEYALAVSQEWGVAFNSLRRVDRQDTSIETIGASGHLAVGKVTDNGTVEYVFPNQPAAYPTLP